MVNEEPNQQQDGDPRRYDEEVSAFVERFAADLTEAGMQRMASRVFACLLAEDSGVLSSADISERLQVSPAAVSGAVRYLAQLHLISREREPGSRRERYRVHADIWYEAVINRDAVLGRWITTFRRGLEAVGPESPAGHRIAETAEFFEFMKTELTDLPKRWHTHRARVRGAEKEPGRRDGPRTADDGTRSAAVVDGQSPDPRDSARAPRRS